MRIAVVGCGAMGGLYGAYLSRANDVTVIDVNETAVKSINERGLTVVEPDGTSATYHPHATTSTEGMEPVDALIVFVKAMFSKSALESNRGIIGKDTYLITLQNGSGHEDLLRQFAADDAHVVIGTTQHNAARGQDGEVLHGGSGDTYFGCPFGSSAQLEPLAQAFCDSGLPTHVSDQVQQMVWNKMFTNVSASVLTGILQVPLGFIAESDAAWGLAEELVREAVAVARGIGLDFDADEKVAEVRGVCERSPKGLTSIYADLAAGRKTEVDTISGSVVRASQKCGVPAPAHEFAVALVHAMEDKAAAAK